MPTTRNEDMFLGTGTFAKLIVKRMTTWTLRELMSAAGVPDDVSLSEAYRDHGYGDGLETLGIGDISVYRVQFFDKDGIEYKQVRERVQRPSVEWHENVSYVPMEALDASVQKAN